ncbi:hypothetical protein HanXRQr2_Chr02g0077471 [Helianthus annuus]|uniref:Uncharacterized protein n=1 Tax=Helianthus annuus TaxID=4232 RepID=A0A9K3P0H8_HELAN|nr:hypothetical protein HanXRQr2_Chr02g0077471 [Helianthus annuus]
MKSLNLFHATNISKEYLNHAIMEESSYPRNSSVSMLIIQTYDLFFDDFFGIRTSFRIVI